MTNRTTQHTTFVIERSYAASPARLFGAWADPTAKASWFKSPDQWRTEQYELDFRVGGRELSRVAPIGGAPHTFDCRYQDIVPGRRIVYCYDMYIAETRISVSRATVEFEAAGSRTRMIFTEQVVFLDGYEDEGRRERGTQKLLDQLEAALVRR
jgi:uncharacterized protein YndB with AHSA1/START domain